LESALKIRFGVFDLILRASQSFTLAAFLVIAEFEGQSILC
jgi:hypothetical protein